VTIYYRATALVPLPKISLEMALPNPQHPTP
jgi:hypothetical protein